MAVRIDLVKKSFTYNTETMFAVCATLLGLVRECSGATATVAMETHQLEIKLTPYPRPKVLPLGDSSAPLSFDSSPRDSITIIRFCRIPVAEFNLQELWTVEAPECLQKGFVIGDIGERYMAEQEISHWLRNVTIG